MNCQNCVRYDKNKKMCKKCAFYLNDKDTKELMDDKHIYERRKGAVKQKR